jgi:cytoskeletal protein CcmA (bactofilin family)
MFSKKVVQPHEIASLVGGTTTIIGNVEFSGGLRIDGVVKGSVRCVDGEKGGMLVISENGRIEGEVRAGHLVVAGSIVGPVCAAQLIELQPKARIVGDVRYRALEMHHGAIVEGMMIHLSADGKSETKLDTRVDPRVESKADPRIEPKAANLKLAVGAETIQG